MTQVRRVVTGHNQEGEAIIVSDGPPPSVFDKLGQHGLVFHEIWRTNEAPVIVGNNDDPTIGGLSLTPKPNGSVIRIVDIPPETFGDAIPDKAMSGEIFEAIGANEASTAKTASPHPLMHRTETVDYGVVLSGEIDLILDTGSVRLQTGDVVIQRGTNHAWGNNSGRPCRMLFVLLDGKFDPASPKSAG